MMNEPIGFIHENEPPRFLRAQALPYPDLKRIWTRVQLTEFATRPDLEMVILGPEGEQEAAMVMVDVQHAYVSLTMHLKRPQPGQPYRLILSLTRDDALLDQREVIFPLVFMERDQAKAEADAIVWSQRGVAISPVPARGTRE